MNIFSKIAAFINGAAPNQSEPKQHQNEEVSTTSTEVATNEAPKETEAEKSEEAQPAKKEEAQPAKKEEPQPEPERPTEKSLYVESRSEQRYAWHKHLTSILSKLDVSNYDKLKHFTIYIRRVAGASYQWNDEAFTKELLTELETYDCASHVGNSSFSIEIVSDKVFGQWESRNIDNDTQFKAQIKDIILFGSKKKTNEQRFATAIDKRAFVIGEIIKKLSNSTGTDSKLVENLTIIVVRNEEDDDMTQYDWVGKRFEDDLKRELANAFLDKIGSKSLQIMLKPKSEAEGCLCLIENQVYYKWEKLGASSEEKPEEMPYKRCVATLSIIEGTGSMIKPAYTLDSDSKKLYHIGRGVNARKNGKYRINDIVIKDKEADPELLDCNAHVSSAHADIVFKNNAYYVRAAAGGCRASGGSPTKIVRDENATELRDTALLYPLEDGDILELGKTVLLQFTLGKETPQDNSNNAMTVDDTF